MHRIIKNFYLLQQLQLERKRLALIFKEPVTDTLVSLMSPHPAVRPQRLMKVLSLLKILMPF